MKRIMAVDPGGTSGFAILKPGPQTPREFESTHAFAKVMKDAGHLMTGEIIGKPEHQANDLFNIGVSNFVDLWIIESFYLEPPLAKKARTADILLPVKVGYGLSTLVYGYHEAEVKWQPSSSMTVITDERLRRWGLWVTGKDARAALKHLIVHLRGESE